jgi:hypothetical protein
VRGREPRIRPPQPPYRGNHASLGQQQEVLSRGRGGTIGVTVEEYTYEEEGTKDTASPIALSKEPYCIPIRTYAYAQGYLSHAHDEHVA